MTVKLAHSYSALKMYENCPKRYYHQRITKEVKDTPGTATVYGERVHKQLEEYLKAPATGLPEESVALQPLCDTLRQQAKDGGMLLVEEEYTLTANITPTSWFAEDAWLRFKLDVLIIRNNNTAVVVDWKTGKRRPDFDQLEMFALAVFAHWPAVRKVKSMFIWTKENAIDQETYRIEHKDQMWTRLMTRINRVEKSLETDVWPAKPSGLCKFCPCKGFCEFAS
jgi:CRISPR/Cas system-associated exonuclease Cas4 (RecB family)